MTGTGTVSPASHAFADAAHAVQRRLVVKRGLELLLKTWRWAALAAVMLAVVRLLGLPGMKWNLMGALMLLWLAGCAGLALWQRPAPYVALAFWDRAAGRGDAFANAWWFEQQPEERRTRGQVFHLKAQHDSLGQALPKMPREVTLPDVRWLPVLPVCALALMFIPMRKSLVLPDPVLSASAQAVARKEGERLADRKLDTDKLQGLTAQEKSELEKLQARVQETAKALEQQQAKTARGVLGELERRAREAEDLAEKLGAGDAAWASEQMVAEMRKHADTAALGDAVANKSPENTGKEAQGIADKLKSFELSIETRDRYTETLREIGKQAQAEDKDRTVGQHMIAADRDMAQTLPQDASREFQALADKMRTLAAREKAREQLEKLAQQLRDSGSNVAGEGTKGMQQLAGSQDQKGSQGAGSQGQQGMMSLANAPQMQPMQMPGLGNPMQLPPGSQSQQGAGQQMQMLSPSQGKGQEGKPLAVSPGNGKPGKPNKDGPMLFAPVPGGDPNQPPSAMILGAGPSGVTPGGSDPGNATSKPDGAPTEKAKPGQSVTADVQRSAEGVSAVRTIEGQAHQEQTVRNSQSTVFEAIAAEEGALDDAALPPARREQVRRYFNELRERFEKEK